MGIQADQTSDQSNSGILQSLGSTGGLLNIRLTKEWNRAVNKNIKVWFSTIAAAKSLDQS